MNNFENIMELIHPEGNPFEGFVAGEWSQIGWGSNNPIFQELIKHLQPKLILEVGSLGGLSAINMSKQSREFCGNDACIICVDTWLGSDELRNMPIMCKKHGFPQIYQQFLSNVSIAQQQDRIVPFPSTSRQAARFLLANEIYPDLVYLDGSHHRDDVYDDLRLYSKICKGTIFGHDYGSFLGVTESVDRWAEENNLIIESHPGKFFVLKKK